MFHREKGLGLVGAIALIVISALLAVAITRTVWFGADATSLDVLDKKALLAADTGAQVALNRVFAPEGVGACSNASYTLTTFNGLESCSADTTCSSDVVRGRTYYTIDSTGSCNAGALTTSRAIRVRARR